MNLSNFQITNILILMLKMKQKNWEMEETQDK